MRFELTQALSDLLAECPSTSLTRVIDGILREIEDLEQNTPGTVVLDQIAALEKDKDDLTERVQALEQELDLINNQP